MSNTFNWESSYTPAMAENGKFVVINNDYLQSTFNYPSSGYGRYAVLTKEAGPISLDETASDAFGRLRVSEPFTMFNSKLIIDKQPNYWDEVTHGSSSSVHVSADAMVTLSVNASSDYAIRQTRQRFIYQPGKSLLIMYTFVSGQIETNVIKRVGSFHGSITAPYDTVFDGIYFESNGVTNSYNLCISKSQGTNQGVNSVPQSAWNVDKMDGTGLSRITLDFSKNQILFLDYEWLGVGQVRLGFIIDGKFIIAHKFKHTNISQNVYMTSPNLPVRYEIRGAGTTTSVGKFGQICTSIQSEGGYDPYGNVTTVSRLTSVGPFSVSNVSDGEIVPLLGIRLNQNSFSNTVQLLRYSILPTNTMSNFYEFMVLRNPSLGAYDGNWVSLNNSAIQYNSNSTITARITATGNIINSNYFTAPSKGTFQSDVIEDVISIGNSINGVSDTIFLALKVLNGNDNANVYCNLTFRELR